MAIFPERFSLGWYVFGVNVSRSVGFKMGTRLQRFRVKVWGFRCCKQSSFFGKHSGLGLGQSGRLG